MVNVAKIERALKMLAVNKRYRFNAHQVAYLSGNSKVNEVYNYLVTREPYTVQRSYEVMCPERMDSAASYPSLEAIPDRWIECRVCGCEFIPDRTDFDMIHIVFDFNPDYLRDLEVEIEEEKKLLHPMIMC